MTVLTTWGEDVARHLLDETRCPVCASVLADGCCARCGADLRGEQGASIRSVSQDAAAVLRTREALLSALPRVAPAPPSVAAPAAHALEAAAAPAMSASRPASVRAPQDSTSLQSVLAVAGAGLFGIAAIVFTFLNPDLTDRALRSVIVAGVTVLFLAASLLLARRGLRFSAEAIGGLGLVFVGIDVWAFAQLGGSAQDTWLLAAFATAIGGGVLTAGGLLRSIRSWTLGGVVGLAAVPAMVGYAAGDGLGTAIGHLGTALLAALLIARLAGLGPFERRALTALQLAGTLSAPLLAFGEAADQPNPGPGFFGLALMFALIAGVAAASARFILPGLWSFIAGGSAALALLFSAHSVVVSAIRFEWWWAVLAPVATVAFAMVALVPIPRAVGRIPLVLGALVPAVMISAVPMLFSVVSGLGTLSALATGGVISDALDPAGWSFIVALLGASIVLAGFGRIARHREPLRILAVVTDAAAMLAAAAALFAFVSLPVLPLALRVDAALVLIALAAEALRRAGRGGAEVVHSIRRLLALIALHALLLAVALNSWADPRFAPVVGVAVLVVLAVVAAASPAQIRFAHVGVGFGYALVCLGAALQLSVLSDVGVQCLTASAALIAAIAATFLRRIDSRSWYAILVVTAVPFLIGVAQVVVERSGWTALSTTLMCALCVALLVTRRPGLTDALRVGAAALIVPTIAVAVLCLGAQLLTMSGSPVVLPIIAVIVAVALGSGEEIARRLRLAGRSGGTADAARIAIECTALVTAAIAVALALVREAAGLGTAVLALGILCAGGIATALLAHRRYGWLLSAVAGTGALWCVWGMLDVSLIEAYVLPPALGAAVVGVILVRRGARATGLYTAGLGAAVGLTLILSVDEMIDSGSGPWRSIALLAASWLLLGVAAVWERTPLAASLRVPTRVIAAAAATGGVVLAVRVALGETVPGLTPLALFALCIGIGVLSGAVMVVAASGIRRAVPALAASRWLSAPAALAFGLCSWVAIERDWASIWAMWALMIVVLAVMVTAAVRAGRTVLPPVWFLFVLAFVTAVVAWSPRDLRVEWFSLPLGAFLIAAGIAGMRTAGRGTDAAGQATIDGWPAGAAGSWRLLAPGIIVMMSASVVATFTDPLTWRAVLVMVLALIAILVGSARRFAAPFVLGLVVLPVENVFVFAVQIGRGIESMPWWITLAVVGAVLLILAVTYERKGGARMGDLR